MKADNRIPVLMYHSISAVKKYSVGVREFTDHLRLISENRIESLTAEDFLNADARLSENKLRCLITFDDGYEDNYLVAFPLLKRYNHVATFFVITGRIGTPGYMSWKQLKDMLESGMSVQSHTLSHRYLSSLDGDTLGDELTRSKKDIERNLSVNVSSLSVPYGDFNRAVVEDAYKRGYRAVFTSQVKYARPGEALIPRINIDSAISRECFASMVIGKKRRPAGAMRTKQIFKDAVKKIIRYRKR